MEFISITQLSERWGISPRRIQILCKDGRIPGAFRVGSNWAIPENVERPVDKRIKSGRYKKEKTLLVH